MTLVKALAVSNAQSGFVVTEVPLRALGSHDIRLSIKFAGICHSDIHQARNEWFEGIFPMVPGHEIVGEVTEIGEAVTKFKIGDIAGVGVMVDSCGECEYCIEGRENVCLKGNVQTYNGLHYDGEPTYGGYSNAIVLKESFALKIPTSLDPAAVAPLLCAGITVYTPLKDWGVEAGKKVAILGFGGLGHIAVKMAVALGAEVYVLGRSESKRDDAIKYGAKDYLNIKETSVTDALTNKFDVILNTTSANLELDEVLSWLRVGGALVNVGLPGKHESFNPFSLIGGFKAIAGSNTGGISQTQEMLDFCANHKIEATIEVIQPVPADVDAAYERVVASDVKYRFVIDMRSF